MKLLPKFGVELHQTQLKNGVNVFLFKRKGMPIYLRAAFFAGSRFDNTPGTAHFLEHMFLAGTKRFPAKNIIADYIQRVGGDFSASTGNGILQLTVEIPEAQDLDIGIEVLSECLTNSLFEDKTIENERGAIISELRSKKNNPKEYISEVQRRLILQGTSAGRSTLGSEEEVRSITKNNLLDYQKEFINSGRMCFIASGDVPIEVLEEKLNSIKLEVGNKFEVGEKLPIIKEETIDIETYKDIEHLQVSFACRTSMTSYKEYCALAVLNNILGGGRGARLVTKLRYENGLVYSVSTSIFETSDWGSLSIGLSCDKNNFEKVRGLIFAEFADLREKNITSEELDNTKSRLAKSSIRHFQTSGSWVGFHERDALFSPKELRTVEDYIQTTQSLTLEDIKSVVDKYLLEENFYTAVCGDYKK